MNHDASLTAVVIFALFVAATLGLSFWLGRRTKGAAGYFAAHGQIPWFVNGVAFAGDYLSAASFLGICGMIAFHGYDGFLYSIGFLAGWVVALFVIAEPMKRLGKFTFADALDAKFNSRGIKIAAGLSTLAVSVFYLIPQMVGAGALVTPLLGLPHWAGVALVGGVVIAIVTTAGMVSTTWVQFIKGGLLVVFSTVLVGCVLWRGLEQPANFAPYSGGDVQTQAGSVEETMEAEQFPGQLVRPLDLRIGPGDGPVGLGRVIREDGGLGAVEVSLGGMYDGASDGTSDLDLNAPYFLPPGAERKRPGVSWKDPSMYRENWYVVSPLYSVATTDSGGQSVNGAAPAPPGDAADVFADGTPYGVLAAADGPLDPVSFLRQFSEADVNLAAAPLLLEGPGAPPVEVYYPRTQDGTSLLTPGNHPKFAGIKSDDPLGKLNFLSLMLALFCGTASLPHILIRYYTVKDAAAARKSTIVGIATIGFFYVLTLYIGLGAMTSGALDPTDSNLAAPLLARSFGEWLFACISAVAFTTVLGTVSGLILASAGAVSHDLMTHGLGIEMDEAKQVRVAKIASVVVGAVAIGLGIVFQGLNVGYLVGWAFSVAASANLPALVCILFWRGTTAAGVVAGVTVGMVSSLAWILLSSDTFEAVYGLDPADALTPFTQPGIVTIPLGFAALVVVSLATRKRA